MQHHFFNANSSRYAKRRDNGFFLIKSSTNLKKTVLEIKKMHSCSGLFVSLKKQWTESLNWGFKHDHVKTSVLVWTWKLESAGLSRLGVGFHCSFVSSVSAVFHNQTTKQKTTRKSNKTIGSKPVSMFCWHPPILAERWVIGLGKSASSIRLPSSKCRHQY